MDAEYRSPDVRGRNKDGWVEEFPPLPGTLTYTSAKWYLRRVARRGSIEQCDHEKDIARAFGAYLEGNPDEDDFAEVMQGLILSARMLWMCMMRPRERAI